MPDPKAVKPWYPEYAIRGLDGVYIIGTLHEYCLIRRDGEDVIATNPDELIRYSKRNFFALCGVHEHGHILDKIARLFRWRRQRLTEECRLTKMPSSTGSKMYTVQIGDKTHAVKLGSDPEHMAKELRNQLCVYVGLLNHWKTITEASKALSTLQPVQMAKPEAEIVLGRIYTSRNVCAGFMMEYIPPMKSDYARTLANKFLDPTICNALGQGQNLKNARFHLHLGEMSPSHEALDADLSSRPVYFDQLWREAFGRIIPWARTMGITLAIIHWVCQLDGKGVKFLIPSTSKSAMLWMTSFGDCNSFKRDSVPIDSLIKAVTDNPTWPQSSNALGLDPLRSGFSTDSPCHSFLYGYRIASNVILGIGNTTPSEEFIIKLQAAWQLRPTTRWEV
ncbi:hypothetical protein F66182_4722 [Fusarium sp. NRRL 66182]|nr:hypothetical protein F66182_4722 [Fusarium sp. NRRL 66182]